MNLHWTALWKTGNLSSWKNKPASSRVSEPQKYNTLPPTLKLNVSKEPLKPLKTENEKPTISSPVLLVMHLDVEEWLKKMDLEEYSGVFKKFQGVEDMLELSEVDIKELGVKKSSHRALIIHSLTVLRSKYHGNFERKTSVRHSLAITPQQTTSENEKIQKNLESAYETTQSKSLDDLLMEPTPDPSLNSQELRKALEWELSLDSRDLRSHAWYHGAIPRSRAEEIVREEGGFLVRDCTSQPGNYVLTCRTKSQALHFMINKQILQPDTVYEKVQYQFEGEAFDTVSDLITFYVGSGQPITALSGARIQFPKNRMYPLSFYASKYPTPLPHRMSSPATTPNTGLHYRPVFHSQRPNSHSPTKPPKLPSKKQRSHSLTPSEVQRVNQEKCNSADGVIQSPLMTRSAGSDPANSNLRFSTHSLPRIGNSKLSISPSASTLGRTSRISSDSTLSPCEERKFTDEPDLGISDSPPPKPSRIPSIIRNDSKEYDSLITKQNPSTLQRVTSYHASGSDSGNGSGDSAMSSAAGDVLENQRNCGVVIKNPRYNLTSSESSTTLKNFDFDMQEVEENLLRSVDVDFEMTSCFDLENYQTLLLPVSENKPLDAQALNGVKMILRETGSRILANHLTRTDLDLIYKKQKFNDVELNSGIELCILPHGHQFRQDLIERTECLKLLVAVTILTCGSELERTETLHKWIEIAIDTKTALGNLFGFCGIMLGLCLPQIEKLHTTWHLLRQKHTDAAFNFEAKLRPTLKNMNNCSNPQAPNTTIPHLMPIVLLLERNLEDFQRPNAEQNQLTNSCLGAWESNAHDFGLTTMLNHLESARKCMDSIASYKRNAEIVLGEAKMDEITLAMFQTEFQLKFLWGSRNAAASANERHSKFHDVLMAMSVKYCNLDEEVKA